MVGANQMACSGCCRSAGRGRIPLAPVMAFWLSSPVTNPAIPLAVLVGSPAYLDGYAALPLTRGLIDHGMSLGAAMAFLVSGSVVSI